MKWMSGAPILARVPLIGLHSLHGRQVLKWTPLFDRLVGPLMDESPLNADNASWTRNFNEKKNELLENTSRKSNLY
jgi:hypothetical protein